MVIDDIDKQLEQIMESANSTQLNIIKICDAMKDLLLYKNNKYGDQANKPINVFSKLDAIEGIKIRLDDKIKRVINNEENIRINDVCDLIGYLILLLNAMNVTEKDIEKFKD